MVHIEIVPLMIAVPERDRHLYRPMATEYVLIKNTNSVAGICIHGLLGFVLSREKGAWSIVEVLGMKNRMDGYRHVVRLHDEDVRVLDPTDQQDAALLAAKLLLL